MPALAWLSKTIYSVASPALAPNTRYELKVAFPNLALPQLRSWVRLHPAGFRTTFPPRQVNNIYFDTPDNGTLNDHLAGVPARRKLRLRWYSNTSVVGKAVLELKQKHAEIGWKDSQPVTLDLDLRNAGWPQLVQQLQAQASGQFADFLHIARPVLINHYERDYYATFDGSVRLTLDYNLTFYDQAISHAPNLSRQAPKADLMLIEVKSPVADAKQLNKILSEFPQRTQAYSKYLTGRLAEI